MTTSDSDEIADQIVREIAADLDDRSGLGLDSVDDEIKMEILTAWRAIVVRAIAARLAEPGVEEVIAAAKEKWPGKPIEFSYCSWRESESKAFSLLVFDAPAPLLQAPTLAELAKKVR